MILIIDSGSSKADWVLIKDRLKFKQIQTEGFNPYYFDFNELKKILKKHITPNINPETVDEIYFYGAGCSTENKRNIINNVLSNVFTNTKININHDLLGAARALFGRSEGIACILGTGSNSCYYDGNKIVENVPSLGYLFGDEGSGTYMGKIFLTNYLKNKIPENLKLKFDKKFKLSLEQILDNVYNYSKPNRFISSFSKFLSENISEPFVKNLVRDSFMEFFSEQVCKYSKYSQVPVSFIGTVAFIYENILREAAQEIGISIQSIEKNPVNGLIKFHISEEKQKYSRN
ncbi:MAG: ATPase [Bacteroidales bacterium]|nr:ATPase [Bacteroidales bacterium]